MQNQEQELARASERASEREREREGETETEREREEREKPGHSEQEVAADEDAKEPAGQAVQLEPTITDPEAGAAGCAAYLPTGHASHVPRDVAAVRARERE